MEILGRLLYELKWQVFRLVEWINRSASRVGREPFPDSAAFPWVPLVEMATPQILERPLWFPINLMNRLVLAAIRRSRFVEEAVENLRLHRENTDRAADTGLRI